jgi:CHAT domain-containing protein
MRHPIRLCYVVVCTACLVLSSGVARSVAQRASTPELSAREARIDRQLLTGEYVAAFSGAVTLLRERLATSGPRSPETLDAIRRVGVALREIGDWELADAVWRIYRDVSAEVLGPCDPRVAEALAQLGTSTKSVSIAHASALPYYLEAESILDPQASDMIGLRATIARFRAYYYRYLDTPRSIDMLEQALAMFERDPTPQAFEIARTRVWLAWTLLQSSRHEEAREQFARAQWTLDRIGLSDHPLVGVIEASFADMRIVERDWQAGEREYLQAIGRFERARQMGSTRFGEFLIHGYNIVALAQLKQGRPVDAWQSLQRYRSQAGKRLHALAECESASPAVLRAARERVVANRGLRRQRDAVFTAPNLDWKAVLAELDANARLFDLESSCTKTEVSGVTVEDVQSVLPERCAFIGWLDASAGNNIVQASKAILDSRWIYIIRASGPITWIPLWEYGSRRDQLLARGLASTYGALLWRSAAWTLRLEDDTYLTRMADSLSVQEFNPALEYLADVDQLVVEFVEDNAGWRPIELFALPDSRYLGERFVVSYTPSADAFVEARRAPRATNGKAARVVAIGNPIFSREGGAKTPAGSHIGLTQHRAATNGDPAALDHLPQLPFAGVELDGIRAAFPTCETLTGDDATEANVRGYFARAGRNNFDIVHFATHGLSETQLMQRCALALGRRDVDGTPSNDGLLDALEIELSWNLHADLVTLSSCQTVSGHGFRRGEPWGLATVFLAVGAKSVVASLWKVDDLATAHLMERFYENLSGVYGSAAEGRDGNPMSKAAALAEAKRWLRQYTDENGRRPFAHPVYWSGFILMGDPD